MDPLTALGLAGNIFTFVEFTGKILKRTIEIYNDADHNREDYNDSFLKSQLSAILITTKQLATTDSTTKVEPETIPLSSTEAAKPASTHPAPQKPGVRHATEPRKSNWAVRFTKTASEGSPLQTFELDAAALNETLRSLVVHTTIITHSTLMPELQSTPVGQVASACDQIAKKLLHRLESRKAAKGQVWTSLKHAIQELWPRSEVKDMLSTLEKLQGQLVLHVVASIKDSLGPMQRSLDLLNRRQSDQFHSLNSVCGRLEELIQAHMISWPNAATTKSCAEPATVSPEASALMVQEHEKTRRSIIQAINEALGSRDLKPFYSERPTHLDGLSHEAIRTGANKLSTELRNEEKTFVESLKFPVMVKRKNEIDEAEMSTFDWIFEDSELGHQQWNSFSNWLLHDGSLYWITGKAGSGKSTMMKHLFQHKTTHEKLIQWAGSEDTLVVAAFFFWNTGTDMQKTQDGLLRSLLYQTLYRHRELVPLLLPETRRASSDIDTKNWRPDWHSNQLLRVFQRIVRQKEVPLKICFFIDGLDEYDGEDMAIGTFIRDMTASDNVKACVSSRPHLDFQRIFESAPSLILSNLTAKDIKTYVSRRFNADTIVTRLQLTDGSLADYLSEEIVKKAQGVFLWVKFVVGDLLRGLGNEDKRSDLEWRLNQLPPDLETLYLHILRKIEPSRYREQAAKLLRIVFCAQKPLTLLQLAFADEVMDQPDLNLAINAEFSKFSGSEQQEMCTKTEKRLNSRCLGLIEVDEAVSDTFTGNTTRVVQFMHQSVVDFVQTKEARDYMHENLHGQSFCPYTILMQANILVMKHLTTDFFPIRKPATYLAEGWYRDSWKNIRAFMNLAAASEAAEAHNAQKPLIDAMDAVATQLANELLQLERSRDRSPGYHWSGKRQKTDGMASDASMISFAIEYRLYHYVESYFNSGGRVTREQATYALLVEQEVSAQSQLEHGSFEPLKNRVRDRLKSATRSRLQFRAFLSRRVKWKGGGELSMPRVVAIRNHVQDMDESVAGQHRGATDDSREWQLLSQTAFPDIGTTRVSRLDS